jgi:hypothetical protein
MSEADFVVEDYKLALSYLQGQFQRLWQRFSFFLTIQLALFGLVGTLAFKDGALGPIPLICGLGLAVSIIWYVVAAEDSYLVSVYRTRVEGAAERVGQDMTLHFKDYGKFFVGIEALSGCRGPLEWYWRRVSITHLPVLLAVLLCLVWLTLLLSGKAILEPYLSSALPRAEMPWVTDPAAQVKR